VPSIARSVGSVTKESPSRCVDQPGLPASQSEAPVVLAASRKHSPRLRLLIEPTLGAGSELRGTLMLRFCCVFLALWLCQPKQRF
jgi:hypothetical protein